MLWSLQTVSALVLLPMSSCSLMPKRVALPLVLFVYFQHYQICMKNPGHRRKMNPIAFLMQRRVLAWIAVIEAGLLVAQVRIIQFLLYNINFIPDVTQSLSHTPIQISFRFLCSTLASRTKSTRQKYMQKKKEVRMTLFMCW